MRYFLGMEVARSKEGILISQRKYTLDLLKETGKLGCKPANTPLEPNWKYNEDRAEKAVDKERYQRLVGRLIYLSLTRLDISYVVSKVSQYMHSPTSKHLNAAYHILRYLKGTPGKGILYRKTEDRGIQGFMDANWTGSLEDSKSTSDYYTKLWGNLVTWRSKKPLEPEYRAIAQGICEVIWLGKFMNDLKMPNTDPTRLYCDSKSAISIVNNPIQHDRMKYVRIDRHFIR